MMLGLTLPFAFVRGAPDLPAIAGSRAHIGGRRGLGVNYVSRRWGASLVGLNCHILRKLIGAVHGRVISRRAWHEKTTRARLAGWSCFHQLGWRKFRMEATGIGRDVRVGTLNAGLYACPERVPERIYTPVEIITGGMLAEVGRQAARQGTLNAGPRACPERVPSLKKAPIR